MFEPFEDEDCWLTPSRPSTERFCIEAYLSDLKLGPTASRLAEMIARTQQRRCIQAKPLKPVTEESGEEEGRLTSTPRAPKLDVPLQLPLSPISTTPAAESDEDDFEDAPDRFSEEAMERISKSPSFIVAQALLSYDVQPTPRPSKKRPPRPSKLPRPTGPHITPPRVFADDDDCV